MGVVPSDGLGIVGTADHFLDAVRGNIKVASGVKV